jgi:hypothetical protein
MESLPATAADAEQPEEPDKGVVARAHAREEGILAWWSDNWPVIALAIALIGAIVGPLLAAAINPEHASETQKLTWTALAAAFSATTLAFLVTLAWDRRQRRIEEQKEVLAEQRRAVAAIEAEQESRSTEAKRRFSAILLELERLKSTLEKCREQSKYKYFFPDLPSGSWEAANERLGVICSNYAVIADLSIFYGEVDELQWRLRFKANAWVEDAAINPIIDALVEQMIEGVQDLLHRVRKQVVDPDVARLHTEVVDQPTPSRKVVTRAIRGITAGRRIATPPSS